VSRATEDALDGLHALLADSWADRVKESQEGGDVALTAAERTALAKFLKDNNITALAGSSRIAPLVQGMEALDESSDENLIGMGRFRTSQ
jgi:hypothetical protein